MTASLLREESLAPIGYDTEQDPKMVWACDASRPHHNLSRITLTYICYGILIFYTYTVLITCLFHSSFIISD